MADREQDRELLRMAAKAIGINCAWSEESYGHRDEPMTRRGWKVIRTDSLGAGLLGNWWNPLTNDGDALRLAVALGIGLLPKSEGIRDETAVCAAGFGWNIFPELPSDAATAARRAIVLAAAEIGASL